MLMAAEPRLQAVGEPRLSAPRAARLATVSLSDFRQEQLAQVQRARILAGAVHAVSERGAANVAIAEIVQSAGVSRRTFYELFANRDDCLIAAFDDALTKAAARVLPALNDQHSWVTRLRTGVTALMGFLDEEPQLGRLLICDSLSGPRALSDWRAAVVVQLVAFVDEGRGESRQSVQVPSMQAEGSVGGALTIAQNLLTSGQSVSFTELSGSLVAMIAMPYLGRAAARRELERPAPPSPAAASLGVQAIPPLPFKDAGMRLTYRTMRVLLAIAGRPGASNREVGDLAEIGDQGQTSKLLRRLQRAELISNEGVAPGQGAPNVWRLTSAGEQLAEGIRVYSEVPGSEKGGGTVKAARSGVSVRRGVRGHNSRRGK